MKRSILFIICALCFGHVLAQEPDDTFQFFDLNGDIVADGSIITVSTLNEEDQMVVPLIVKNVNGMKAAAALYETINGMPNGEWQTCAFGNCVVLSNDGYSAKDIVMDGFEQDIQTEWIPQEGQYATWTATLQIHTFNIITVSKFGVTTESVGNDVVGYGPTVTVKFVYSDPASVNNVANPSVAQQQCYSISGQRMANGSKGLAIVRMADGHVVKKIVR